MGPRRGPAAADRAIALTTGSWHRHREGPGAKPALHFFLIEQIQHFDRPPALRPMYVRIIFLNFATTPRGLQ